MNDQTILNVNKAADAFKAGPTEIIRVASSAVLAAARAGGFAASHSLQTHFPELFSTIPNLTTRSHNSSSLSISSSPSSSISSSISRTTLSTISGSMYAHLWNPSLISYGLPRFQLPVHFLPVMSQYEKTEKLSSISSPIAISAEAIAFATLSNNSERVIVTDPSKAEALSYCLGSPTSPFSLSPPVTLAALQLGGSGNVIHGTNSKNFGLFPIIWKNQIRDDESVDGTITRRHSKFAVYNGLGSGLFLNTAKEIARLKIEDEEKMMMPMSLLFTRLSLFSTSFAQASVFQRRFAEVG